jgi:hypothetical protein
VLHDVAHETVPLPPMEGLLAAVGPHVPNLHGPEAVPEHAQREPVASGERGAEQGIQPA